MKHAFTLTIFLGFLTTSVFGQNYERYKKLLDTTFTSKHLGYDKHISITVPTEWQKDSDIEFPLMVVFDKQNQRSHNYILNSIDYLTSNEQMPSSILVSVESDDDHRVYETLHRVQSKKGLALENENFLFEELIPLLENNFNASSFRVFIGHSRYGYFTTSLLSHRINDLNAVVAISPRFMEDNVNLVDSVSSISRQKIANQTFFRFATGGDFPKDFYKMDSLIKVQTIEKFDVKGVIFPEATHNVTPGLAITTSLYEIFEHWSKNQSLYLDNKTFDLAILDSFSQNISTFYGKHLNFSLGVLNGKGWYFYGEEQYADAIRAWDVLLKTYPNFSEGYLNVIDAQMQLKIDHAQTVEKFKASLAASNRYSEKEKNDLMQELHNLTK